MNEYELVVTDETYRIGPESGRLWCNRAGVDTVYVGVFTFPLETLRPIPTSCQTANPFYSSVSRI